MNTRILAFALLCASGAAVHALDISDYVIDKLQNPIADANVCLQSDTSHCVATDQFGSFRISDGIIGVRPATRDRGAFALEYRGEGLSLSSPYPTRARIQWNDAGGRAVSATRDLRLSQGRNALPLPDGLRKNGLAFLRIYLSDATLTWKAVLMGGAVSATRMDGNAKGFRAVALSKAMVGPAGLEISKTGYQTLAYQPGSETESDKAIILTASDDSSLQFKSSLTNKVLAIDTAKMIIVTESLSSYCYGDSIRTDTLTDTSSYEIRDGKMYVWYPGDCFGKAYSGSAVTPVGDWTLSQATTDLPEDLQSTDCSIDESSSYSVVTAFAGVSHITSSEIKTDVTVDLCPGDIYRNTFEGSLLLDSTVTATTASCRELDYKNGKGDTAKILFTQKDDSIASVFSYKTATCLHADPFGLIGFADACPANEDPLGPLFTCLGNSGFATPGMAQTKGLAKSSVTGARNLPMSVARKTPSFSARGGGLPKSAARWFPFSGRHVHSIKP